MNYIFLFYKNIYLICYKNINMFINIQIYSKQIAGVWCSNSLFSKLLKKIHCKHLLYIDNVVISIIKFYY